MKWIWGRLMKVSKCSLSGSYNYVFWIRQLVSVHIRGFTEAMHAGFLMYTKSWLYIHVHTHTHTIVASKNTFHTGNLKSQRACVVLYTYVSIPWLLFYETAKNTLDFLIVPKRINSQCKKHDLIHMYTHIIMASKMSKNIYNSTGEQNSQCRLRPYTHYCGF